MQNRPAGGPPGGSFVPVGPNLAAKAARKPCLGGSGGALGALLAARGAVLKPLLLGRPGPLLGALGVSFGTSQGLIWTIWTMSVALREIQQKPCILHCFWASKASRRGPKSFQNRLWGRPCLRNRFRIDFGPILAPTWDRLGSQEVGTMLAKN